MGPQEHKIQAKGFFSEGAIIYGRQATCMNRVANHLFTCSEGEHKDVTEKRETDHKAKENETKQRLEVRSVVSETEGEKLNNPCGKVSLLCSQEVVFRKIGKESKSLF